MHMRNAIKMVGLVSVLTLSACGGDKGEDLGRFVGTWQATSGMQTAVCDGYTYTSALTGSLVWSEGISSDLLQTSQSGACAMMADVRGLTASGLPGKTCSGPDGTGGVQTVTYSTYTFVLSPDGHTATENGSGQITIVDQGVTLVCTFNATGSYQKIGN
jgi:hypothetical protein